MFGNRSSSSASSSPSSASSPGSPEWSAASRRRAAGGVFIFYSALNGLTLSVVFLAYTSASIVSTFVVTAGMFGAMSVYGLVTKRSLDGLGSFAFMGLIGVVIASLVNIFLK